MSTPNPAVVYICEQPSLMDEYTASREQEWQEFRAATQAFKERHNLPNRLVGVDTFMGGHFVTGYAMESYSEELPAGWRRDRDTLFTRPAKRTPEGKAIAAELGALFYSDNLFPGVPDSLRTEGYRIFPRTEKIGDYWFLTLSKVPYDSELEKINDDLWGRVKLSMYHTLLEQQETAPLEEHDEEVCSLGDKLCRECYAAGDAEVSA